MVPLIGVPPTATQEVCDCCGRVFHIIDAMVTDVGILCPDCVHNAPPTPTP